MTVLLLTLLTLPAVAGKKSRTESSPRQALETVLVDAGWTLTPERSSAFRAGDIYDLATNSKVATREQCFEAVPQEDVYTSLHVVQAMSASANVKLGVVKLKGGGVQYKQRTFAEPYLSELPLLSQTLTADCARTLGSMDVSSWAVLTAVLSAEVKEENCTTVEGGASVAAVGAAELEVTQQCREESAGHVAIAYKTRPVVELLPGATTPAAPSVASPASRAAAPPPPGLPSSVSARVDLGPQLAESVAGAGSSREAMHRLLAAVPTLVRLHEVAPPERVVLEDGPGLRHRLAFDVDPERYAAFYAQAIALFDAVAVQSAAHSYDTRNNPNGFCDARFPAWDEPQPYYEIGITAPLRASKQVLQGQPQGQVLKCRAFRFRKSDVPTELVDRLKFAQSIARPRPELGGQWTARDAAGAVVSTKCIGLPGCDMSRETHHNELVGLSTPFSGRQPVRGVIAPWLVFDFAKRIPLHGEYDQKYGQGKYNGLGFYPWELIVAGLDDAALAAIDTITVETVVNHIPAEP